MPPKKQHQELPDKAGPEREGRIRRLRNDGADRRSEDAHSPYFDCTLHNMRREWSKWRDLGANGQVLEWICHGVAVLWVTSGPPPRFN